MDEKGGLELRVRCRRLNNETINLLSEARMLINFYNSTCFTIRFDTKRIGMIIFMVAVENNFYYASYMRNENRREN